MARFQGLIGIVLILMIAFLFSNNKKRINYRLVLSGLALQLTIGILILKIPAITRFFQILGKGMGKIEEFARQRCGICIRRCCRNGSCRRNRFYQWWFCLCI